MKNAKKTWRKRFAGPVSTILITAALTHADFVTATIPAGTNPFAVAVNPVTNRTYVANYGSGTVTVINAATNDSSTITVGSSPRAIAINSLTNKIYVANFASSSVSVIDGATNTVTTTVSVQANPNAIAVNPATNMIYVTNYASATVTKINGISNATSTIPVGLGPIAVCVNPVTNRIYVANSGSNSVTVINGATNDTASVAAGTTPYSIAANTVTNKIYVANQGSNNVTVIDGGTNGTTTITAGNSPSAIAVNLVTDTIYVTNSGSNNVTIIDGATGTVVATPTVGTSPGALAINTTSNKIYVANYGSSSINVITGAAVTGTLTLGTNPNAVAINPITNKIYTANYGSGNVTVVDGATNQSFSIGVRGYAVGVNPVTNRIYVIYDSTHMFYSDENMAVINGATNQRINRVNILSYNNITTRVVSATIGVNPVSNKIHVYFKYVDSTTSSYVIDGATNLTGVQDSVPIPSMNRTANFNPVTNKIYGANYIVNPVTNKIYTAVDTGIDETPSFDTKLRTFFDSLPYTGFYNTTFLAQPTITGKAVNRLRSGHTGISSVLISKTTAQSSWGHASLTSGAGTDSVSWTWVWGSDTLLFGENFLCAVALDSQAASTNNPGLGTPFTGNVTVYPIYRLPPPATAPVLISPLDKSVGRSLLLTFSWNTIPYVTYYTLQVSSDSLFSSFVFNGTVGATSQIVSVLTYNTTYYWRVNAGNYSGTGPWSDVWRFTTIVIGVPILSSPANGAVNIMTPTLSWNTVATASSYSVQVSTDSNFSITVVNQTGITDTNYQAAGLLINTVYYWRVNASNGAGTGDWSDIWRFTTISIPPTPLLSLPVNNALGVSTNFNLSWHTSAGAASYTVQVSIDTTFSSPVVNDSGVIDTSHVVHGLSTFALYYWRVKAVNIGGSSAWSLVRNFMTGATGVLPSTSSIPRAFSITGSSGMVRYSLPVQCHVNLKYYDLRGRLVASLVNSTQQPGYYALSVRSALPAHGAYIRIFEAGSFIKREIAAMAGK
jgi:YVTN family beta-propeller protein